MVFDKTLSKLELLNGKCRCIELDEKRLTFVRSFLQKNDIDPNRFHWEIHPEDEMFYNTILQGIYDKNPQTAYLKYLESGKRTLDVVEQIVQYFFSDFNNLDNFLEFACGHGRFSRYLVQKMPSDKIYASDIYKTAVEWQKNYFGVNTIQSCSDPKEFDCDEKFSFILVGSMFSHLPGTLFKTWLNRIFGLLDDRGILVFSVRDEDQLRDGQTMPEEGIIFSRESESDSLSRDTYGLTQVTEDYVCKALNDILGSGKKANFIYFKKALYENQALYIVAKDPSIDLSGLELKITPMGGLQNIFVNDQGERVINGWGIDLNQGNQISEAQLFKNDKLMSTCQPLVGNHFMLKYFPNAPNEPVAWSLTIDDTDIHKNDLMTCRLKSQKGSELIFLVKPV